MSTQRSLIKIPAHMCLFFVRGYYPVNWGEQVDRSSGPALTAAQCTEYVKGFVAGEFRRRTRTVC